MYYRLKQNCALWVLYRATHQRQACHARQTLLLNCLLEQLVEARLKLAPLDINDAQSCRLLLFVCLALLLRRVYQIVFVSRLLPAERPNECPIRVLLNEYRMVALTNDFQSAGGFETFYKMEQSEGFRKCLTRILLVGSDGRSKPFLLIWCLVLKFLYSKDRVCCIQMDLKYLYLALEVPECVTDWLDIPLVEHRKV